MSRQPKIALVHDELIRRGGAEVVFEEILRLFPDSDVYSLYAGNRPYININNRRYHIRTSFIQRLPLWFRRRPGRVLPLLPYAADQFDLSDYDLVISSASGFAKGVITRSNIPHLSYCHTPIRYLWDSSQSLARQQPWGRRFILRALQHYLRLTDFAAAQRPDIFLANSRFTQKRIATYYRRDSRVIYPPINTAFFTPQPNERLNQSQAPFLVVGRLTATKNFDQAIIVCEKLRLPLIVIGTGTAERSLKRLAGRYTTFMGHISEDKLRQYYRQARALLQPGVEDFGMASVEALACGTPVIALGQGGAKEIINSSKLGILYRQPAEELLAEAVRQFLAIENSFRIEELQQRALDFSRDRFGQALKNEVEQALAIR